MNAFRLIGDLCHLAAILILLLKIWKSRSVAGETLKYRSQTLNWLMGMVLSHKGGYTIMAWVS